ncbi:MAG: hypothetical protein IT158_29780 [Bryobacterales bacterium]|nr:hypothetical protein [Bryobacterales bacterium]
MLARTPVLAVLFFAARLIAQLPPGFIDSIAGTGASGYSGDGGSATGARIEVAYDVAADAWGNLYLADTWNHRIRKIAPDGVITVFAGNGAQGFSGDGSPAVSAMLNFPRGLAVDAWGNVFLSDSGNGVIRKVDRKGIIQTVAGNRQTGDEGDGGQALKASFRVPRGLAADVRGNLYIADTFSSRIRRVAPDGVISTVAGNGRLGYLGDGGPATQANLGLAHSLAVDHEGTLYFSDTFFHCVRRVRSDGIIETAAGTGQPGFSGDGGPATAAQVNMPRGLALDLHGRLYIADSGNNRIRMIGSDGVMSTVIGSGSRGYAGDQGPAGQGLVDTPYGLAADPRGNVYVADLLNYRVRKARFEPLLERPSLTAQAVLNAASYRAEISPGGLISLFGENFGYRQLSFAVAPLAPSLGGTSVIVNGSPVPMLFVSPAQINAQLPWAAPSSVDVKVSFGGVESDTVAVPVSTASPGILLWGANRAVVQNADYTLNTPSAPAARGSVVVLYASGLGAVSPVPGDGAVSPASPLAETAGRTTAQIGAIPATVRFSGMTPGYIGLWQVNIQIPSNAPAGDGVPVKIAVGGSESNEALISVR